MCKRRKHKHKSTTRAIDRPQIRSLIKDTNFISSINDVEASARKAFANVVMMLGGGKQDGYNTLVENLATSFHSLECSMTIKLHFLHSHLDKIHENLWDVIDEHRGRFVLDIKAIEKLYQGRWGRQMMADYSWSSERGYIGVCHRNITNKSVYNVESIQILLLQNYFSFLFTLQ